MELEKLQNFLVQVYTNNDFREAFFKDPVKFSLEKGFSEKEAEKLSEMSKDYVDFFSQSLHHKRLKQVMGLLPLTHKILGRSFSEYFIKFSQSFVPSGITKHKQDALNFIEFLSKLEFNSKLVKNIIKYEKCILIIQEPKINFLFKLFDYDSEYIENFAKALEFDLEEKRNKALLIFFRLGRNFRARRLEIKL